MFRLRLDMGHKKEDKTQFLTLKTSQVSMEIKYTI